LGLSNLTAEFVGLESLHEVIFRRERGLPTILHQDFARARSVGGTEGGPTRIRGRVQHASLIRWISQAGSRPESCHRSITIVGVTALQVGNGVSSGDANAIHFTAASENGRQGLTGSLYFSSGC
jgi:hypothetical protein